MTGETNTFKIEHGTDDAKQVTEFELSQLPSLESLELADEVFAMMPALSTLKGLEEKLAKAADEKERIALTAASMVAMSRMTKHVVKFAPHFQKVCKARRTPLANAFTPLTSDVTFDMFFGRQQSLLIKWVLRCVEFEYSSFLAEESSPSPSSAAKQPPST